MKASFLFKQNIDALLRARGQTRHDLAMWCRRSDPWLSKILGKDDRNVPMKYLDRMADFFGLAVYQLFQPGITPLTERRSGRDRRSGMDRRVGWAATSRPMTVSADLAPADIATIRRLNLLTVDQRRRFEHWMNAELAARGTARGAGNREFPEAEASPPVEETRRIRRKL